MTSQKWRASCRRAARATVQPMYSMRCCRPDGELRPTWVKSILLLPQLGQSMHERRAERGLCSLIEFEAVRREIENVDSSLALGIDERHFYVAATAGKTKGDLTQQARGVLGDDLQQ